MATQLRLQLNATLISLRRNFTNTSLTVWRRPTRSYNSPSYTAHDWRLLFTEKWICRYFGQLMSSKWWSFGTIYNCPRYIIWKYKDFMMVPCILLPPLGTLLAAVCEVSSVFPLVTGIVEQTHHIVLWIFLMLRPQNIKVSIRGYYWISMRVRV